MVRESSVSVDLHSFLLLRLLFPVTVIIYVVTLFVLSGPTSSFFLDSLFFPFCLSFLHP